ncbi:Fpg/Nei family DNA glycosylase [Marisediminicola sp. LYQ134]|uniref:Fpg/Nei family DNA glycosylase n=1 Tax=unclassified Marisediminicola TaxID=2618316 RepID=UPI003983017E
MPEGHSVHRIARQFSTHFVGKRVAVSSPQGRFASDAARLDGHEIVDSIAVGKQLFLEFDHDLWLRVHLGIYGAWDFAADSAAELELPRPIARGAAAASRRDIVDAAGEDSAASIGAPRTARLRMAEQENLTPDDAAFPPDPVGAVRVRLLADDIVADLRGPTACEVQEPDQVRAQIAKLGPDPLVEPGKKGENRFTEAVLKKGTPIGLLLMDQSVVSGIGNVYRAEMLFRARLDPHRRGKDLDEAVVRALWRDWTKLLKSGVEVGQMMTMDGLSKKQYAAALRSRADRHWVYHREGLPCRVCGTPIRMEMAAGRKLYWCPTDQV